MNLILASASSARAALLKEAGIPFDVVPSKSREVRGRGRTLSETVRENARRKAAAVARLHPDRWVLAADTMIAFKGKLYGKPRHRKQALDLLTALAGHTHVLATGVVLRKGRTVREAVARSKVTIRTLSPEALLALVNGTDPTRYAGGYAIQNHDDPLVEKIEGSRSNVVGLPMEIVKPLVERLLKSSPTA